MVKTTRAQREALYRKWMQMGPDTTRMSQKEIRENMEDRPSYREFRKTIQPYLDGSGCIMVPWCGMWLGIETDGYTHS